MSPVLSIVFLNYNRLSETRWTLERLLRFARGREDIEIIAVDNGSTDGTREYIGSLGRAITPVLLNDNLGIAGYNRGFEQARGKYLLVLDDDSCPSDSSVLDLGVAWLDEHPETGIVACRIETPTGELQWSWHLPEDPDRPAPSVAFVGCGFFIRRDLFRQIGWYPEDFFLYQNELEVSIRCRLEGAGIDYLPECRVIHRGVPATRPGERRIFFSTRNTLWLIRRYFPPGQRPRLIAGRLLIGLGRALWFRQMGAYMRAVREGLERSQPYRPLPTWLRSELLPFRRQNEIFSHFQAWRSSFKGRNP